MTYNRVKGYAKRVVAGESLRAVFMDVAIDAAVDYAGGKLFGAAVKGMGKVGARVAGKGVAVIERNHVLARFLGGADDGMLGGLSRNLHRGKGPKSWHNILRKNLRKYLGDACPPNLSTEAFEELLTNPMNKMRVSQALVDAAGEFDDLHGGNIISGAMVQSLIDQWFTTPGG